MTQHIPPSDESLARQWIDGNRGAGQQLLARHYGSICMFFAVRQAQPDLAQQTFVAALEARDRVDPTRAFRGYLHGIAKNQRLKSLEADRRTRGHAVTPRASVDPTTTMSTRLARQQEHGRLRALMERLPEKYSEVLELYYWSGDSAPEIARKLGLNEGTVWSRIGRAKARLRAAIHNADPDHRPAPLTCRVCGRKSPTPRSRPCSACP